MLTIYKPGQVPVRGLRTSLAGSQLGDGYFQAIANLRWDTGVLKVRSGIATVSSSAPSTTCRGAWAGTIQGTYYVVSAWDVGSDTAVYVLNLSTGVFTEITDAGAVSPTTFGGDTTGKTRLDTDTAPVTFTVANVAKRFGPTAACAQDVLIIQNLEDFPLIFYPGAAQQSHGGTFPFSGSNKLQVFQHKNIVLPAGAQSFRQYATFSAFLQVASTTGANSYTNSTAISYSVLETTAAPYNAGSNYCARFQVTTGVAVGATARYTLAAGVEFWGEQVNFIVEGTLSAVTDLFTNCALDFSSDNVTYYNAFDSSSTGAIAIPPKIQAFDTSGTRFLVTYSIKNIPMLTAARTFKHVRFTRKNGPPSTSYATIILGIVGAGPGAGFEGGTEFTLVYGDSLSQAESHAIVAEKLDAELLKNIGGPSVVTAGAGSAAGTRIIEYTESDIVYDYRLLAQNTDGETIMGGLAGQPQCLDLYFRTASQAALGLEPLFWTRVDLYRATITGSDHKWVNRFQSGGVNIPVITLQTESYGAGALVDVSQIDRALQDDGTPAPSSHNVAMPRAFAVSSANGRTFVGCIKDADGNKAHGDIYFSSRLFPFRYQAKQTSEDSGSRLVCDGQTIKAFVMSAAAANGASTVYVLTDQKFYALGTAGGFVGSGYDTSSLSILVAINSHGTQEPGSVVERNGNILYIDSEGQAVVFTQGSGRSVSRLMVDDRFKNIPASLRGKISATFWKDRWYIAYAPALGSDNTRIIGFNPLLDDWEFDDPLPGSVIAQRVLRVYDSSQVGSGQRLLIFGSSDSKVYAYEEGSSAEPGGATGPAIQLRTREVQHPALEVFRLGQSQLMIDAQARTLNVDCYYKPSGAQFRGTIDLTATSTDIAQAIKKDTRVRTEVTATGVGEKGWAGYLDLNGNLAHGSVIWRWECDMEMDGSKGAGSR